MKALPLAILWLSCVAGHAASPEATYLAARDRDVAALAKVEGARDADAKLEKALATLQRMMTPIIGPVAVVGFPTDGKLNLESLFAHDEGYAMLDGLVFGDAEGQNTLVVSTDGLLDAWLVAHGKPGEYDPALPRDPAQAVRSEIFYTWAMSTGSAAVHYAEIPITAPTGAKFAQAMLSARTQDQSPPAPDRLFVALEQNGRVFLVERALKTPMTPIRACDAVMARYTAQAEAAEKTYAAHPPANPEAPDPGAQLRDKGDAAFRACYGDKVKGSPAFKAATSQAAAIVDAVSSVAR